MKLFINEIHILNHSFMLKQIDKTFKEDKSFQSIRKIVEQIENTQTKF